MAFVGHDAKRSPDLLLVIGTSLSTHGVKPLVRSLASSVHSLAITAARPSGGKGRVVFIGKTPPSSAWHDVFDYWIEGDCDTWVREVQRWKADHTLDGKSHASLTQAGVEQGVAADSIHAASGQRAEGSSKSASHQESFKSANLLVRQPSTACLLSARPTGVLSPSIPETVASGSRTTTQSLPLTRSVGSVSLSRYQHDIFALDQEKGSEPRANSAIPTEMNMATTEHELDLCSSLGR